MNKLKLIRIFVQNNDEEPIDLQSANFTNAVHKGLKLLNMQETYSTQAYAWFVFDYFT